MSLLHLVHVYKVRRAHGVRMYDLRGGLEEKWDVPYVIISMGDGRVCPDIA